VDVKQVLHLLRAGAASPPALLGERDWIADVSGAAPQLLPHGSPALPPGALSFDELHRLIATAELIVTW
jgi:hypothetical protein